MKTIRSKLENENIWAAIKGIEPFPFIKPETNELFILWHGQQWLFSKLENESVESIAAMIVHIFGDKWERMLEVHGIPMTAHSMRTIEETVDSSENRTNERSDRAKVAAYNSEALLDESGNDSLGNEGVVGGRIRHLTDTTESLESAFNNLTRLDRVNIIKVAMDDVANFMKLDVY